MEHIEKVMNKICLVELVGCTMNMCMLKYYFLTVRSKIRLKETIHALQIFSHYLLSIQLK